MQWVHLRPDGDGQLRRLAEDARRQVFPSTHEDLLTVAVFHGQPGFLLARTRLESADIECFAYDENMLRIGGYHSHILGGIKLQVRESEAQDAMAILRHTAPLDNP